MVKDRKRRRGSRKPLPAAAERRLFRRRLLAWYDRSGRDLPWRFAKDPYQILVSEIMLQQTQVDRVLPKYREWLERFEAFLLLLRTVGAALGGFLVLAALVIVTNTIKLTLYARQDELEAMTMVGATSLFIKLPYLIEGALQGLCGGLLALLVSFIAFRTLLRESLGSLLLLTGIDTIHFLPPVWQVLVVAAGTLVGLLGSSLALRKFVRFCQG